MKNYPHIRSIFNMKYPYMGIAHPIKGDKKEYICTIIDSQ